MRVHSAFDRLNCGLPSHGIAKAGAALSRWRLSGVAQQENPASPGHHGNHRFGPASASLHRMQNYGVRLGLPMGLRQYRAPLPASAEVTPIADGDKAREK